MKTIPLTHGYEAQVDDEDYDRIAQFKWHVCLEGRNHDIPYARRTVSGPRHNEVVRMHREILGLDRGELADHVNGNTLDNTRGNLRRATRAQNVHNRRSQSHSTRHKGIYRNRANDTWTARIRHCGWICALGTYDSETDAALAYDRAAEKLFGEFARLNFPAPLARAS